MEALFSSTSPVDERFRFDKAKAGKGVSTAMGASAAEFINRRATSASSQ
jgi:hypothetical protein